MQTAVANVRVKPSMSLRRENMFATKSIKDEVSSLRTKEKVRG